MWRNPRLGPTRRGMWVTCLVALALVLAAMGGCQGLPKNVANCPVTPTPPSNTSVVPPAAEPPPAALCGFPLQISTPVNGASVRSPVPFVATAKRMTG
jgi:hypothetical protein